MCKQVCQVTLPTCFNRRFWFSGVEIRDSDAADRSNQRATQVEWRDLQKRGEQGRDTKVKRFEISLQCSRVVVPRKSCLLFQRRSCVRGIVQLCHVGCETKTTRFWFFITMNFPPEKYQYFFLFCYVLKHLIFQIVRCKLPIFVFSFSSKIFQQMVPKSKRIRISG